MSYRILVTGGAGFIGTHVVRLLKERGHEVTVYDNLSMGLRANVPAGVRFIQGNIEDEREIFCAVREHRIERVCHLAARVSIRASTDGFIEDAQTNIMGTLSVLKAVVQNDVSKVVFASSMAVYADRPTPTPLDESFTVEPISPYGISKLAGESFVRNIAGLAGREYSVLRLFNTYGPGQTYTPYVGVITIFATKLLKGESPVIFGDGAQIRDFVYVGDVAEGFMRALEATGTSGTYNIGSGRPMSVNDVARLLQSRINPGISLKWTDACPGEIRNSVADISAASAALHYKPKGCLENNMMEAVDALHMRLKQAAG